MTPNRRLDQLEPLMADALQKIDRLIEGQGQLVELFTNTRSELDQVKKTGELTANGLANLTVFSQKQFEALKTGQDELRVNQNELKTGLGELRANQNELKTGLDELRANQEQLRIGLDELRTNQDLLKTGQDQLRTSLDELRANQEQLNTGMATVIQYLREKLP